MIRRLRFWMGHRRRARELAEEIDLHRHMLEQQQCAAGLSPEEARHAARRLLGNATLAREDARRVWLAPGVDALVQDLRYAARSLRSQPGFTLLALLALVLGIGLNTSLFTGINAVLNRQWNVPDSERVVKLFPVTQRGPVSGFALTAALFLNENSRSIEGAFAFRASRLELDGATGGTGANTAFVTGNFFDVLHVTMRTGRPLSPRDDAVSSPAAVAVISSFLWSERYGADPQILGRTIRLDGVPFTVIGVAPQSFTGVTETRTDLWIPIASLRLLRANSPETVSLLTDPGRCCSDVAARLRPGVSRAQAQAELNVLFHQYLTEINRVPAPEFRLSRASADIVVAGTAVLDNPETRRRVAPILAVVVAAFGSILLLACANVGNLLLARAASRQREIAVRVAIGAGRGRVIRQLLTESLLLAGIASAGGLLLAWVLPGQVLRFIGQTAPTNLTLAPDLNVLAYALAIAVISALAFGLAPALRGTRISVSEVMKRQSAHASPRVPLRAALLAVQIAISVALLTAAGLLVRGLQRARSIDVGFRTEEVAAVQVTLPPNSYDLAREAVFYGDLVSKLEAIGEPAAVSMLLPLGDRSEYAGFGGVQCQTNRIATQRVSRGYFEVLGIPFLAGGTFPAEDRGRGSIVVNESLARACWEGRNPVGQVVTVGPRTAAVVGVVRDAQLGRIGAVQPTYFAPFVPDGNLVRGSAFVLVSARTAPSASATVRNMDARAATEVIPLSEQVNRSLGDTAGIARMAGVLGLLALLLATVGVYGVISYSVEQRRREIGVRMALGAHPAQVIELILRRNARAAAIGLAVGLAVAAGESMVLRSQLYGLSPADPLAYAGVVTLLLAAGIAASLLPARRAIATDPVQALRHE